MPYGIYLAAVLLVACALIIWQAVLLSRCRFWCKSCGRLFALPWRRLLFRQHVQDEWWLVCPHCGTKGWCRAKRRKEES